MCSILTIVDYLTFWYRTEERSIRVALILASATLAGAFGGMLAIVLLSQTTLTYIMQEPLPTALAT
jgi:hypothetical protein